MKTELLVECLELTKNFSGKKALDAVNLQIGRGKIIGLLGPNGSGKTTLIKILNGLLEPTFGSVLIDGEKPGPYTKSIVSYLPDRTYFADWMKVRDIFDMFSDFYADFDRSKAEEMCGLLNIGTEEKIKNMSKGTKEKVQLILVMSRKAQLYLLDEVVFLKNGKVVRHEAVDDIKEKEGKSIDDVFKDTFRMGVAGYDR